MNEVPARIENGSAKTVLGSFPAGEPRRTARTPSSASASGACVCFAPGEGIPARILDLRFLGDVALVEMAVQGLDAPLLARVRKATRPSSGARSALASMKVRVLVFEENGEQPEWREIDCRARDPTACERPRFAAIVAATGAKRLKEMETVRWD